MKSLIPSLADIGIVDAPPEDEFDSITRFAAALCSAPVALVTIVEPEKDRQYFKSARGLTEPWATSRQTPLSQSFCRYVRTTGKPFVVSDARQDARVVGNGAVAALDIVAYVGVPIRGVNNEPIGALCAIDHRPRHWTGEDVETLEKLAAFVNTQIQLRGALFASERHRDHLQVLASTDPLTGLSNRRAFFDEADGELRRVARSGRTLALLVLDLDHFKRINDSFGHDAGDMVLVEAGRRIAQCVRRKIDVVARLGGEEFALLLPETDVRGGLTLAERIRQAISQTPIQILDRHRVSLTASVGVALGLPTTPTVQGLLKQADRAVYRAKTEGRDRVVLADGAGDASGSELTGVLRVPC